MDASCWKKKLASSIQHLASPHLVQKLRCRRKLHPACNHFVEEALRVRFKAGNVAGRIGQQYQLLHVGRIAEAVDDVAHCVRHAMRTRFACDGDEVGLFQRLNQSRVDLCAGIARVRYIGLHSGIMLGQNVAAQCGGQIVRS